MKFKKYIASQKEIVSSDITLKIDYSIPASAFSPLVAEAAGIMVSDAVKILTNVVTPSLTNQLKAFSFSRCEIKTIEKWNRNRKCPVW